MEPQCNPARGVGRARMCSVDGGSFISDSSGYPGRMKVESQRNPSLVETQSGVTPRPLKNREMVENKPPRHLQMWVASWTASPAVRGVERRVVKQSRFSSQLCCQGISRKAAVAQIFDLCGRRLWVALATQQALSSQPRPSISC